MVFAQIFECALFFCIMACMMVPVGFRLFYDLFFKCVFYLYVFIDYSIMALCVVDW